MPVMSTFSIVAANPDTGELGVAVQSKFLAVGAVVPWVKAGVGAIATQAWANTSYGPKGLDFLQGGFTPEETVMLLTRSDSRAAFRQLGIISADGRTAAYTGEKCSPWAGHAQGIGYACQGNILTGPDVVTDMARGFESSSGDLAERMICALEAAQAAGGDSRGMQSAALYIAKDKGGYGGLNDRFIDLRVDEHTEPIQELRRIMGVYRLYFYPTDPNRLVPLTDDIVREIQSILTRMGYPGLPMDGSLDDPTRDSLNRFFHLENFEGRIQPGDVLDGDVLAYMREKYGK
jgi:uncharacterized Ntn-hydrolase superfamily protein